MNDSSTPPLEVEVKFFLWQTLLECLLAGLYFSNIINWDMSAYPHLVPIFVTRFGLITTKTEIQFLYACM